MWRNLRGAFAHPYSQADAEQWIALNEGVVPCTTSRSTRSLAVGGIGLIPRDDVAVQTAAWATGWASLLGPGLATAAARAWLTCFFHVPFAVRPACSPGIRASMRVLEKAWFVREGVLRRSVYKDGQLIDSVMYARVRDA